jgi:NhaP-type Na+/H+ or K+/H+ antiporter
MPALRTAGLSSKLSNLLSLESAITDVLCVVAAASCVRIILTGSTNVQEAASTLGTAFAIGLSIGALTGFALVLVLRRLKRSAYAYPVILGTLLLLYVLIDSLGGSAALGILTVAVMAGNAPALSRMIGLAQTASLGRSLENVHDQMTFIIKSFFFTLIGAMLGPPWTLVGLGVLLGLTLAAVRYPVIWLVSVKSGWTQATRGLLTVSLPRGMAAGVLAMLPAQSGVEGTEELPAVVFAAVITTIVIFAGGFPVLRRRLPSDALESGADEPSAATATGSGELASDAEGTPEAASRLD